MTRPSPQEAAQGGGEDAPGHTDLMVSPEGLAAYLGKQCSTPMVNGKPVFGEAVHLKFTMEHELIQIDRFWFRPERTWGVRPT